MRDWIVIPLIGLLAVGVWSWARRLRGRNSPEVARSDVPKPADVESHFEVSDVPPSPPSVVTNISIPRLPETEPVAVLEFEGPPGKVSVANGEYVIGRHSDDDVRVPDVRVSRHHARLVARNGVCEILNLTAARSPVNPMLVNGETKNHARVVDGDVVTLGGVSFKLRLAIG